MAILSSMDLYILVGVTVLFLTGSVKSQVNQQPVWIESLKNKLQVEGLKEDTPTGTVIGTLLARDPEGETVRYYSASPFFSVEDLTGKVTLIKELNYDVPDPNVEVQFVAIAGGQRIDANYKLIVHDVNDNPPVFYGPFNAAIQEYSQQLGMGASPGSFVYGNVRVSDLDGGGNNIVDLSCYVTPTDLPYQSRAEQQLACDTFFINTTRLGSGNYSGSIYLKKSLDYETQKEYRMNIIARDSGTPQLNATVNVLITVIDIQDSGPIITSAGSFSVLENSPRGTFVGIIEAEDQDKGDPRKVRIKLIEDTKNYFMLDNTIPSTKSTGAYQATLRVRVPIDKEQLLGNYPLKVEAVEIDDKGNEDRNAVTTGDVSVNVQDVNDNKPKFANQSYTATVPEELPMDSSLPFLAIEVRDLDSSTYDNFEVGISSQTYPGAFALTATEISDIGIVSLQVKKPQYMDYEVPQYRHQVLKLYAREKGTTERWETSATVTVNLMDINDNAPKFDQDPYRFSVAEDRNVGDLIITIRATDQDSGVFGEITYSLFKSVEQLFSINSKTGEIRLKNKIDYESIKELQMAAVATDGGGKSTTVGLNITILNTNDQDPVFDRDNYQTTIDESTTALIPNVTVHAVDPDGHSVTYSISPTSDPGPFQVDPTTGVVRVTRPVKYTETPKGTDGKPSGSFRVVVVATDSGVPSDTGTATVTIRVIDENDNAPYFVNDPYSGTVNEMDPPGTIVVNVSAVDIDAGTNGKIYYEFVSGSRDDFTIDGQTGRVTVAEGNLIDFDKNNFYRITVRAVDGGAPQRSASSTISVTITDGNNKKPVFQSPIIREYIPENVKVGTSVAKVSATDVDKDSKVRYSILTKTITARSPGGGIFVDTIMFDYKNAFAMNGDTGVITTKLLMDRNRVEQIQFTVEARDVNAPSTGIVQTATQTVSIMIYEVSSGGVVFTHPSWSVSNPVVNQYVQEELVPGTPLFTMLAIDNRKSQAVNDFTKVPDSDPENYFFLNSTSGVVSNNKIMDYETFREKTFSVKAQSTYGGVVASAITKVIVNLQDINDNSPEFGEPYGYTFSVLDESRGGIVVGLIQARDKDGGGSATVLYTLSGMKANHFHISPDGTLTVAVGKVIDREQHALYNLMVQAADGTNSATNRVTTVPVTIQVTDINDNPPVFTSSEYSFYTLETTSAGTSIGAVRATDKDKDNRSDGITYQLDLTSDTSRGLFQVDFLTGVISTRQDMRANADPFEFNIIARDNYNGQDQVSRTSQVKVKVFVGNTITDGRPVFISPSPGSEATVFENKPKGTFVTVVSGRDSDSQNRITYSFLPTLLPDHEKFSIDRITGNITTTQVLDREQQEIYEIIVVLTDEDTPPKTNQRKLYVRVLDMDDNVPLFGLCQDVEDPIRASVPESEPKGTYVTTVTACDKDKQYGIIHYKIVAGDGMELFEIGLLFGNISTKAPLDREVKDKYNLTISATNPKSKKRASETVLVIITVLDRDDSEPEFLGNDVIVTGILASAAYNYPVIQLSAVDKDTAKYVSTTYHTDELSGQYFYSSNNDRKYTPRAFVIEETTGILRTNMVSYADYIDGYFTLKVNAKNSRGKTTDIVTVQIYVFRENYQTKFTFNKSPQEVQKDLNKFKIELEKVMRYKIYPKEVKYHMDGNGDYQTQKADVCVDVVNINKLVSYDTIVKQRGFDSADVKVILSKYGVVGQGACVPLSKTYSYGNMYWLWYILFVLAAIIWLIATILTVIVFFLWNRFQKKMKEAKYVEDPQVAKDNNGYEWQESVADLGYEDPDDTLYNIADDL